MDKGRSTGLGGKMPISFHTHLRHCYHLIIFECVCVCVSLSVMSYSLQPHGLWPARLLSPWDSPGKNTVVDCHFLLQGIFLTQGLNLHLL